MRLRVKRLFPFMLGSLLVVHLIHSGLSCSNGRWGTEKLNPQLTKVGVNQATVRDAADLDAAQIETLVAGALHQAGGFREVIKPGGTVLIKVNLVDTLNNQLGPEVNGITVDWRVARAVVKAALAAGAGQIFIIEGSLQPTARVFQYFGYGQIRELPTDHLIALEDDIKTKGRVDRRKLKRFEIRQGLIKRVYYVNRRLLEADTLISIAVLKTHRRIGVTGTVKSVALGCFPASLEPNPLLKKYYPNDRGWRIDHRPDRISQWISDYYSLIPAKYGIIDGLQGAQYGPLPDVNSEYKMNMRLIIAGPDPIAVDTVATLVMGIQPESVLYLKTLERKGLGVSNPAQIQVVGAAVAMVRKNFKTYYGRAIPLKRRLQLRIRHREKTVNGTKLYLQITSSDRLARIDLLVDGRLRKSYPASTRIILVPKARPGSSLAVQAVNRYLDTALVKVID